MTAVPSFFSSKLFFTSFVQAMKKFSPHLLVRNPVIFITEIGAVLTTLEIFLSSGELSIFTIWVSVWLWFTVLFANFAEAIAECRNKSQADALRNTRVKTAANKLDSKGNIESVNWEALQKGDQVLVKTGEIIPGDGEVIKGSASIDESAITGESEPVIRAAGNRS